MDDSRIIELLEEMNMSLREVANTLSRIESKFDDIPTSDYTYETYIAVGDVKNGIEKVCDLLKRK